MDMVLIYIHVLTRFVWKLRLAIIESVQQIMNPPQQQQPQGMPPQGQPPQGFAPQPPMMG